VVNLLFNIVDTIGRYLGGKIMAKKRIVVTLSILRLIFLFTTASTVLIDTMPFRSDWFRILNLGLYALSNGYLCTQCAIIAPSMV